MKPDASPSVGGATAPQVGHEARSGCAQARRVGISVVDDMRIRELTREDRDAWIRRRHCLWPELDLGEHAKEVERLLGGWGPQPFTSRTGSINLS